MKNDAASFLEESNDLDNKFASGLYMATGLGSAKHLLSNTGMAVSVLPTGLQPNYFNVFYLWTKQRPNNNYAGDA